MKQGSKGRFGTQGKRKIMQGKRCQQIRVLYKSHLIAKWTETKSFDLFCLTTDFELRAQTKTEFCLYYNLISSSEFFRQVRKYPLWGEWQGGGEDIIIAYLSGSQIRTGFLARDY